MTFTNTINAMYDWRTLGYYQPTAAELAARSQRELAELESRLVGLRQFAGPAFSAPLEDTAAPLRETVTTMADLLQRAEQQRDEAKALADTMHGALNLPKQTRSQWDTARVVPNPVKDVEDMVARKNAAEEALKSALATNEQLQDRATVEWSKGQDARIRALEDGLLQLVRDGHITRSQKSRIVRASRDALSAAAQVQR